MSSHNLKGTLVQRFGETPLDVSLTPVTRVAAERATLPERSLDRDDLPFDGDVVGGHYRLVRRLGEGMFGRVYVAERTDVPEHRVALKVMSRAVYGRRNVERELTMLAAASHPHIVQLKDHGVTDDYVWLTMPLYEGETLEERLGRRPLSLREAYEIFLPIARGVQALHERGLRHQDVKPENIFLARFAGLLHPVLLDLGVAVEKNALFVAGTALFGAPEQLAALAGVPAKLVLSEKIDTYCLASTLLNALVGDGFFPGATAESPFDIANAFEEREHAPLREGALPDLTGAPRQMLAEAFSRWLLRDPDERPNVACLADELEVLLEQERAEVRAAELKSVRQKRALGRLRAAFAVVLAAGMGTLFWGYKKRETLRLAAELERARAVGAEGFDKLETCVAAHELSQRDAFACRDEATRLSAAHDAAMVTMREQQKQSEGALAATSGKLDACEDERRLALERHSREQRELTEQKTACEAESVRVSSARAACENTLSTALDAQGECRGELVSCITARQQCSVEPPNGTRDKEQGTRDGEPPSG